jgi:hypothetical protein
MAFMIYNNRPAFIHIPMVIVTRQKQDIGEVRKEGRKEGRKGAGCLHL